MQPALAKTSLLAFVLAACASTQQPAPPAPGEEPLVPAATATRPDVLARTLPNGLRVLMLPDPSSPLVCVQLWVGVGSVDEREGVGGEHGITGLSHFFEHLMFQGTARYPNYDEALNPLGARNNAFTYQDATAYWVWAPREHLPQLLDMEADRFVNLKVDFLHLEPEREVVKNERRLRVDADPAEIAAEYAVRDTFDASPYRWGPIGWMTDLDAITLEEAQDYHARHYHPGNATLIISGGFTPEEADRLLAETWSRVAPRPSAPEARLTPPGERWEGTRRAHLIREAPATTVFLSWRAPGVASKVDFAALELIDHALTAGKSGRVNQALVLADDPAASDVSAALTPLRHPYAWLWRVDLVPGRTSEEAVRAIENALAAIARDGLPEAARARALALIRAEMVGANLSHKDLAETVGFALASTGEPLAFHDRLTQLEAVTQADLQRVAASLLAGPRVRLTLVPWQRLRELRDVILALDPPSSALSDLLGEAFELLVTEAGLAEEAGLVGAEARATAKLAERGARALDATEDVETRAAIARHLAEAEIGTVKRTAALEARRVALAEAEAELQERRAGVTARLQAFARKSRPDRLAAERAVEVLLGHRAEAAEVQRAARGRGRPVASDASPRAVDLAVGLILAVRKDLAGLHASAEALRTGLRADLAALTAAEPPNRPMDPRARALATLAALLDDLNVAGLPLTDAAAAPTAAPKKEATR
jgi:zinc protease